MGTQRAENLRIFAEKEAAKMGVNPTDFKEQLEAIMAGNTVVALVNTEGKISKIEVTPVRR